MNEQLTNEQYNKIQDILTNAGMFTIRDNIRPTDNVEYIYSLAHGLIVDHNKVVIGQSLLRTIDV